MMSDYAIFFDYNNKTYRLPVNPEEMKTSSALAVQKYEVLKLGQIAVPTHLELREFSFEQAGDIGNLYSGTLENIDNVSGVTATLTDIITSGDDEETDDNLRARFFVKVRAPSTSGNADNYKEWALEVANVGDAKVFPLWNGAGTVKVLVVDSNMAIDTTLPAAVAAYIETVRPIGATVTVESPTSKTIDVAANVILDGSQTLAEIQTAFTAALVAYLKDTIFDTYSVSYAKIGSLLLATAGVQDYNTLLINSGTANIVIADIEMPIAGTVTLTEVV